RSKTEAAEATGFAYKTVENYWENQPAARRDALQEEGALEAEIIDLIKAGKTDSEIVQELKVDRDKVRDLREFVEQEHESELERLVQITRNSETLPDRETGESRLSYVLRISGTIASKLEKLEPYFDDLEHYAEISQKIQKSDMSEEETAQVMRDIFDKMEYRFN
ncbi:MAG: hypothetical protein ABEJ72_03145, partial [Candidatus Aenigmatarchaeota archaeon]